MRARQLALCPPELRAAVESMLHDLADCGLEVGLIPAPEQRHQGHYIRVVWSKNPSWYSDLCAMYPRRRRNRAMRYTDSTVKRGHVENVLRRLLSCGSSSFLAEPLLSFAREVERDLATDSAAYVPMVGLGMGEHAACGF